MAAETRENILTALNTMLASITVANGYRTTITTVADKARDWAELATASFNWIGVVPQDEQFTDRMGVVESRWQLDILVHLRISANTDAAARAAASDVAVDIRRLLYNTNAGNLGVAGVHFVRMVSRLDSLGSPEALDERYMTTAIRIVVQFEESMDQA